ncbi:hypothetical protein PQR14_18315 [Paraburkholderia bryophila]|uniref:hypothetical protein n=1 Tax=Burkholderiaceae TaxID=119060 RepID=UPI0012DFEB32|nr:hypothetical protein [Burkholderia sp. 9120]
MKAIIEQSHSRETPFNRNIESTLLAAYDDLVSSRRRFPPLMHWIELRTPLFAAECFSVMSGSPKTATQRCIHATH